MLPKVSDFGTGEGVSVEPLLKRARTPRIGDLRALVLVLPIAATSGLITTSNGLPLQKP
jgi:hypothetical protein